MTRHYFMGMLCAVAIASLGAAVAAADDGEIRLMSYNILHGKGADRKVDIRRTAEAIVRERPDFVGLQEVDCHVSRSGRIDESAELARLTGLHPTFAAAFPFDNALSSTVVNGVNFVTLDNVYGTVTAEQATRFEGEVKKGLPIILCMHCPINSARISRAADRYWKRNNLKAVQDRFSPTASQYVVGGNFLFHGQEITIT